MWYGGYCHELICYTTQEMLEAFAFRQPLKRRFAGRDAMLLIDTCDCRPWRDLVIQRVIHYNIQTTSNRSHFFLMYKIIRSQVRLPPCSSSTFRNCSCRVKDAHISLLHGFSKVWLPCKRRCAFIGRKAAVVVLASLLYRLTPFIWHWLMARMLEWLRYQA
jgi:hypothetical protein